MNVYDLNIRQLLNMAEEIRGSRVVPPFNSVSNLAETLRKYRPKSMKLIKQSLTTQITDANIGSNPFKFPGSFVFYINSTNPTDQINIRWGLDNTQDIIPFQPGNLLLGFPFDGLQIGVPTAVVGATANLLIADILPDENILAL